MSIKFIEQEPKETKNLTYKDVKVNQFFVKDGCLCMYNFEDFYFQLTKEDGTPYAIGISCQGITPIDRLLPIIKHIEY